MDKYEAIKLLPVISKVLEGVIFSLCDNVLHTDNLHFGFKSGIGCSDAISNNLILNLMLKCALLSLRLYVIGMLKSLLIYAGIII